MKKSARLHHFARLNHTKIMYQRRVLRARAARKEQSERENHLLSAVIDSIARTGAARRRKQSRPKCINRMHLGVKTHTRVRKSAHRFNQIIPRTLLYSPLLPFIHYYSNVLLLYFIFNKLAFYQVLNFIKNNDGRSITLWMILFGWKISVIYVKEVETVFYKVL